MEAAAVLVAGWMLPSPAAAGGKPRPECEDSNILILTVLFESLLLICSSQLLHRCILGRLGQPAAISQMLAGFLLGPSVLGQIKSRKFFDFDIEELSVVSASSNFGRILFMFLIGLEIDIAYLLRAARRASFIVAGGMAASSLAAAALFEPIYLLTSSKEKHFLFLLPIILLFTSSASPVLVRVATELKLAYSEVGRLGVAAALINDTVCLFILAAVVLLEARRMISVLMALLMLAVSTWVQRPVVAWLNKRNEGRGSPGNWELGGLVAFVVAAAGGTEIMGYSSTMAGFVMGVAFPREGCVARTLVERLSYPVNNFVLPVFFGFMAAQTDVTAVGWRKLAVVAALVAVSSASKVAGTAVAARYLGMAAHEGVVLGFLLNIRGHVDLLIVATANRTAIWDKGVTMLMMVTVVCHILLAAPMAAVVVKLERRALSYRAVPLERLLPDGELRFLLCVHGTRDVPTMLNMVEIAGGDSPAESRVSLYLLHLIELTNRVSNHMLYHQQEESGEFGLDSGGEDTRVIATAGDVFRGETGITVHQATVVSSLDSMHVDIHNAAADVRASLVILPFHKRQRVDGRMTAGKKALRSINDLAMRQAPCTAGILVDRGLSATAASQTPATSDGGGGGFQTMHHVGVLFFGGGDDREALALGIRLSQHPCVAVTVVRFLPPSREDFAARSAVESLEMDQDVLLAFRVQEDEEREADDTFVSSIFTRYVVSGKVAYMEKYVENGPETTTALCSIEGMFSLYLVGAGENRNSTLTAGMSEWEECSELGPVGDFLASSDFVSIGSVLILKQCDQKTDQL